MTESLKVDCLLVHLPQPLPGGGAFGMYLPLGLLALANLLNRNGHATQVLHWGIEKLKDPDFSLANLVKDHDVGLVGLSLHWHQQSGHCMEVASQVKAACPGIRVLLGGFTASYFAEPILRQHPAVDFIIRGDAEIPLLELVRALAAETPPLARVANLSFRQNGRVINNPITYVASGSDLDALDFADFALLRHASTCWRTPLRMDSLSEERLLDYRTHFLCVGRGCLVDCSFCGGARQSQSLINGRDGLAWRSVDKTLETIRQVCQAGIEHLYLSFDPLPERDYYRELFARLRQEKIDLSMSFECWSLPDAGFIDAFESTFGAGRHSRLILSPESASERLRRRHKGFFFTNRQLYEVLNHTGQKKVRTDIFLSYPLPGETTADLEATRAFVGDLEARFGEHARVFVQNFDLDPGSSLFREPGKYKIRRYCRSFEDYCRAEPGQPKFAPAGQSAARCTRRYEVWQKRSEKADLIEACHRQFRLGRFLQAAQLAQKLLDLDPDDPILYLIAGCCFERTRPAAATREFYAKAIGRFPDQPAFYHGLRYACFNQGDQMASLEALAQANKKWPDLPEFREPLARLGFDRASARTTGDGPSGPNKPFPISIWTPVQNKGEWYFERPRPSPLGDHFASRLRFPARKPAKTRRVAFFGESVAAGYLYAPGLTPAMLLEKHLAFLAPGMGYEVLDFSRTNETLAGLVTTVERALQLSPDLLVVFAGNNWNLLETPGISPYVPDAASRKEYGRLLEAEGLLGPVEEGARQVLEKASRTLQEIATLAGRANLPVILIVPEVNMADWENRQPVPWLPRQGTAHWYEGYFDALRHVRNDDWQAAEVKALAMLQLDGFATSTACHLLARARIALGREEEARMASEAAVDNTYYPSLCFLSAPQAGSMAKAILRKAARQHGFGCIDLPDIFAGYSGQRLQGRRLFLDYCHLTLEGMHVAMAALASEILKKSGVILTWETALEQLPRPEIETGLEATARFGAAVHTAHRLVSTTDRKPILRYWCEEALRASPRIAQTMLDFIAARHPFCPVILSSAQQRNLRSTWPMGYQHGWCHDHLDPELIGVIGAVLEQSGQVPPGRVADLVVGLVAHLGPEGIDLIAGDFFLWEPLERFFPACLTTDDATSPAFFRAVWPQTRFALIGDGVRAVNLEMVMRLPPNAGLQPPPEGHVNLLVNGAKLARLPISGRWGNTSQVIGPQLLQRGLNQLMFQWPLPQMDGDQALKMAWTRLQKGQSADLHPVFGEIIQLRMTWA